MGTKWKRVTAAILSLGMTIGTVGTNLSIAYAETAEQIVDEDALMITELTPLEKDIYEYEQKPELDVLMAEFPDTLAVMVEVPSDIASDSDAVEEKEEELDVYWECEVDYEKSTLSEYTFYPVPKLIGYELESGVVPQIKVVILDTKDVQEVQLTAQVDGMEMSVTAEPGVLPEDTVLNVHRVENKKPLARMQEAVNHYEGDVESDAVVEQMIALDITLQDSEGNDIKPDTAKGDIYVSFYNDELSEAADANRLEIYHFEDAESPAVRVDNVHAGNDGVECSMEPFSEYVVMVLRESAAAAVVRVGEVGYETLEEGVAVLKDGDTMKLLADIEGHITIPENITVTLDLNGKILNGGTQNKSAATLYNKGIVTILDSSPEADGMIRREDTGAEGYYVIKNEGTMTIENGWYYNESGSGLYGASLILNGDLENRETVLNIEGGHFSQDNFIVIKNGDLGILNITGGEFTSNTPAVQNWCQATITGGIFTGEIYSLVWDDKMPETRTIIGGEAEINGKIRAWRYFNNLSVMPRTEITGGTFDVSWDIEKPEFVTITGGTFETAPDDAYIADDYEIREEKTGGYTVKQKKKVVSVTVNGATSEYTDLSHAMEAISAGSDAEVKLLTDLDGQKSIEIEAGSRVKLDLNGKVLRGLELEDVIRNHGTLLISDSSTEGKGTVQAIGGSALCNYGEAVLEAGVFDGTVETLTRNENDAGHIEIGNSVLIRGAVIAESVVPERKTPLVEIAGGIFEGGWAIQDPAYICIAGGTFKEAPKAEYLADGYEVKEMSDGRYTVSWTETPAKDSIQETAKEVISEAKAEDTTVKNVGEAVSAAIDELQRVSGGKELTEEQRNAVDKQIQAAVSAESVSEKVNDIVADMTGNIIVNSKVADGLGEALDYDAFKANAIWSEKAAAISLYIKPVLKKVEVRAELRAAKKPDDIIVELVPEKVIFDVKPYAQILDAEGNVIEKSEKLVDNEYLNGKEITVTLPIPGEVNSRYARIDHIGNSGEVNTYYSPIYTEDGFKYVTITVNHFSEFEVSFTDTDPTVRPNVSKDRDSSESSDGRWIQDQTGWWYRYANGSYPCNGWAYLYYGSQYGWYHFDVNGYMQSGWYTDTDGRQYYLNPRSDGYCGIMLTGWVMIDGTWYYFNPVVGGPIGSLLKSTTTPDGYIVNEKGERIS